MKSFTICFLLLFFLSLNFAQTRIYVPDDYETIQEALNVANGGDIVQVAPGVYYENIIWPDKNGIELLGSDGSTIIDGRNLAPVLTINSNGIIDTNTVIEKFSIVNGGNTNFGGGISLFNSGLKIIDCRILNNNSIQKGGGIFVKAECNLEVNLIIKDSEIKENESESGGGIFSSSDECGIPLINIDMDNVIISNNSAQRGAGLYLSGYGEDRFVNIQIIDNNGAGIMTYNYRNSWLESSSIINNGGDGIYATSSFTIENSEIKDNHGIGISSHAPLDLFNVIIFNNIGGIEAIGVGTYQERVLWDNITVIENNSKTGAGATIKGYIIIRDSKFVKNKSTSGGVINLDLGELEVYNTLFAYNISNETSVINSTNDASIAVSNSTIFSNSIAKQSVLAEGEGDLSITNSNISHNGYAIKNLSSISSVTARDDYWGSPLGPYHPTQNPYGLGDSVNIFVDITPWLNEPDIDSPPLPITGLKVTTFLGTTITLNWDRSLISDLAGYKVYYAIDSTSWQFTNVVDVGFDTTYTLNNLIEGEEYYIAVTCYDTNGNESWFSEAIVGQTQLSSPTLISPENNLVDVSLKPNLEWTLADGADYYRIEISSEPIFEGNILISDTSRSNSKIINGLSDNKKYFWRVYSYDNNGHYSEPSEIFDFTTQKTVLEPSTNCSFGIPINVLLIWMKTKGADTYRVEVNTSENFSGTSIVDNDTVTDTSYQLNNLSNNTTYYWRVTAESKKTTIIMTSDIYSFTTKLSTSLPIYPKNNATGISLQPTLSWSEVEGADQYKVEVNLIADFSGTVIYDGYINTNSLELNKLTSNTVYYWRVTAENNQGNFSDPSEVFSFTSLDPTSVDKVNLPKEYTLYHNYPNPFNPSTIIKYALVKQSNVRIEIYNILGEVIRELVNNEQSSGIHEAKFDAYNLPSGIYFYTISAIPINGAERFKDIKKMVLVK